MIKREPVTHSPSALESNSRISFGVNHNNHSQHSVAPCNPWLYPHHQQHQETMVNSLEQMTAILPASVSSSFLDQLPNHAPHGYSNSSQLIVQSSPSPDSLGDSVSIVSNMARRASATYQSTPNVLNLPSTSVTNSLVTSPVSHSNESLIPSHSRNHSSIRTNLHHHQQQHHQQVDAECEDSRLTSNPHHSHFIYAFQCSLCDTKDDIRN